MSNILNAARSAQGEFVTTGEGALWKRHARATDKAGKEYPHFSGEAGLDIGAVLKAAGANPELVSQVIAQTGPYLLVWSSCYINKVQSGDRKDEQMVNFRLEGRKDPKPQADTEETVKVAAA